MVVALFVELRCPTFFSEKKLLPALLLGRKEAATNPRLTGTGRADLLLRPSA